MKKKSDTEIIAIRTLGYASPIPPIAPNMDINGNHMIARLSRKFKVEALTRNAGSFLIEHGNLICENGRKFKAKLKSNEESKQTL